MKFLRTLFGLDKAPNTKVPKMEAEELDKRPGHELFMYGDLLFQAGKMEAAEEMFYKAIVNEKQTANPNRKFISGVYSRRGELFVQVGMGSLAMSDFMQALEFNPQNASALNNLGVWHTVPGFATPDYPKALDYFNRALEISPERNDIFLNRAVCKLKSGDPSGKQDLLALKAKDYPDADIALQRFAGG